MQASLHNCEMHKIRHLGVGLLSWSFVSNSGKILFLQGESRIDKPSVFRELKDPV